METGLYQGNIAAINISWIFGLIGVFGNVYVIYISIWRYLSKENAKVKLGRVHNFLITNLAIADLFGSVYLLIIASADRYYAEHYTDIYSCFSNNSCENLTNIWVQTSTCSFSRFLANIATILPALITLIIAFDRYTVIVLPHNARYHLDMNSVKYEVILSWLFALSITIVSNVQSSRLYQPNNFRLFTNMCYFSRLDDGVFRVYAFVAFSTTIIVYLITMGLYTAIILHIRRCRHQVNTLFVTTRIYNRRLETRLCIITGILAITNLISWLPAVSVYIATVLRSPFILSTAGYHFSIITYLLLFANGCINPISYTILILKNSRSYICFPSCISKNGITNIS